ncbi:MAG: hypothetical protein LM583_06685 [Desulfurococcaceae archaeon]|nr:hypothetical protein [Desulfurococcaceae archaeon]
MGVVKLSELQNQLLNIIEKNIEWAKSLRPVDEFGQHYFYCPACLRVVTYLKDQLRYAKRKGKRLTCTCGAELKQLDDQFKDEYEKMLMTFYEKAMNLLNKAWEILGWFHGIDEVRVGIHEVVVRFDTHSQLRIYRNGKEVRVWLHIHYLYKQGLDKFVELLGILKSIDMHGEVEVDGRPDHCNVPEAEMRSLGFVRSNEVGKITLDDWYMAF